MSVTSISTVVSAKLDSIAWDFTDAPTRKGSHGIHPYPAKFIPQIPRYLIQLFHPGDDTPVRPCIEQGGQFTVIAGTVRRAQGDMHEGSWWADLLIISVAGHESLPEGSTLGDGIRSTRGGSSVTNPT